MNKYTYILGIFEEEDMLLSALAKIREKGVEIADVFLPYPVHGVDKAAGIKKSRMPGAALVFGVMGLTLTLAFLYWSAAISYPLEYGGKPIVSIPSWMVIGFVLTINIASCLSVFVFFIRNKMFPGKTAKIIDERVTDDRFVIAIDKTSGIPEGMADAVNELLKDNGAVEIKEKTA